MTDLSKIDPALAKRTLDALYQFAYMPNAEFHALWFKPRTRKSGNDRRRSHAKATAWRGR